MVTEASTFNAALVASGKASFDLASAEKMPFADDSFDRVFSTGVIYFWAEPAIALAEVRRVMRPDGTMLMACLAPREAPDFARPEYGFHLHDAASWDALCRARRLYRRPRRNGRIRACYPQWCANPALLGSSSGDAHSHPAIFDSAQNKVVWELSGSRCL